VSADKISEYLAQFSQVPGGSVVSEILA